MNKNGDKNLALELNVLGEGSGINVRKRHHRKLWGQKFLLQVRNEIHLYTGWCQGSAKKSKLRFGRRLENQDLEMDFISTYSRKAEILNFSEMGAINVIVGFRCLKVNVKLKIKENKICNFVPEFPYILRNEEFFRTDLPILP